jgi:ribosomal protein L12E/L44/L45/RPP1/RPP2
MLESQVGTVPHAGAIKNHKPQEQKEEEKSEQQEEKQKSWAHRAVAVTPF